MWSQQRDGTHPSVSYSTPAYDARDADVTTDACDCSPYSQRGPGGGTPAHTGAPVTGAITTAPFYLRCHGRDRKSTRLNSSHVAISYAVFCLKKKKSTAHCIRRNNVKSAHPILAMYSSNEALPVRKCSICASGPTFTKIHHH